MDADIILAPAFFALSQLGGKVWPVLSAVRWILSLGLSLSPSVSLYLSLFYAFTNTFHRGEGDLLGRCRI